MTRLQNRPVAPMPPSPGLADLLRLSLDGLLPACAGLSHWLDRMEDGR